MAERFDDILDQGASYSLVATYTNEDGDAVDLTADGWVARVQVRRLQDIDSELLFSAASSGSDPSIVLSADSTITLSIAADASAAIPAGRWPWEMTITDPDGNVIRGYDGKLTVRPRVTA